MPSLQQNGTPQLLHMHCGRRLGALLKAWERPSLSAPIVPKVDIEIISDTVAPATRYLSKILPVIIGSDPRKTRYLALSENRTQDACSANYFYYQ